MPRLMLLAFTAAESVLARRAAEAAVAILFPDGDFPTLRSETIFVTADRRPERTTPLYVANSSLEEILVNSGENCQWQFLYQLAHELGHLGARGDVRSPREDGHLWVEEAICGAFSVYVMRELSARPGEFQEHAVSYLASMEECRHPDIDAEWFERARPALEAARELTCEAKMVAGHIAANLPLDVVRRANQALITTATGGSLADFLTRWARECRDGSDALPRILGGLAGIQIPEA